MKVKRIKFLYKSADALFCEMTYETNSWFKKIEVKRNVYLTKAEWADYWMNAVYFCDSGKCIPVRLWDSVKYQMLMEMEKEVGNEKSN